VRKLQFGASFFVSVSCGLSSAEIFAQPTVEYILAFAAIWNYLKLR
jgi:hypothetical protein